MRRLGLVIFIVYVVIGVFVARSDGYFKGVDDLQSVVSAILAVLLWPLVLLGIELNIGGLDGKKGGDGGGKKRGGDGGKGVLVPFCLWKAEQCTRRVVRYFWNGATEVPARMQRRRPPEKKGGPHGPLFASCKTLCPLLAEPPSRGTTPQWSALCVRASFRPPLR